MHGACRGCGAKEPRPPDEGVRGHWGESSTSGADGGWPIPSISRLTLRAIFSLCSLLDTCGGIRGRAGADQELVRREGRGGRAASAGVTWRSVLSMAAPSAPASRGKSETCGDVATAAFEGAQTGRGSKERRDCGQAEGAAQGNGTEQGCDLVRRAFLTS